MADFNKIYHANTNPFTALTTVQYVDCGELTPEPNLIGAMQDDSPASWKPNGSAVPLTLTPNGTFFEYYGIPLTRLNDAFRDTELVNLYSLPDTAHVTYMHNMFYNCGSLEYVNGAAINTSNAKRMDSLFAICRQLKNVDVSTWDTSKCENMAYMFYYCQALTDIDLSGFDTSKVDYMHNMFTSCPNLTKLDLSSFNLANVWNMQEMFYACDNLEFLLMNGFGTKEDVIVTNIFNRCAKWGNGSTVNRSSLTATLVYNSFDRAGAGYAPLAITLPQEVAQRLTATERNTMTRKGYTITIQS